MNKSETIKLAEQITRILKHGKLETHNMRTGRTTWPNIPNWLADCAWYIESNDYGALAMHLENSGKLAEIILFGINWEFTHIRSNSRGNR